MNISNVPKGLDGLLTYVVTVDLSSLFGWWVVQGIVGHSYSIQPVRAFGIAAGLTRNNAKLFDGVEIRRKIRATNGRPVVGIVPGNPNVTVQSMMVIEDLHSTTGI